MTHRPQWSAHRFAPCEDLHLSSTKIVKLSEYAGCNGQLFLPLLKIYSLFFIEDDLALAYEIDLFLGKSAGSMATDFLFFRENKYLRRKVPIRHSPKANRRGRPANIAFIKHRRFFVWWEQTMICRQQTMVWRQQTIVWWEQTMSEGDKSERWRALVCLKTRQIVLIIKLLRLREKSFVCLRCSFADYAQPDRCTTRWQYYARARGESTSQRVSPKTSSRRISIVVITNRLCHRWAGNMQERLPVSELDASA